MSRQRFKKRPSVLQPAQLGHDIGAMHRALFHALRAEPLPTCTTERCLNLARFWPVLVFYSVDARGRGQGCRAMCPRPFCAECQPRVAIYQLLTDATWADIDAAFAGSGMSAPDRKLTDLEWFDRPPAVH